MKKNIEFIIIIFEILLLILFMLFSMPIFIIFYIINKKTLFYMLTIIEKKIDLELKRIDILEKI